MKLNFLFKFSLLIKSIILLQNIQVQDELKNLRSLVTKDGSKVDLKVLQASIQKAETEVKQKSDYFINQLNNQVKTLPTIKDEALPTANIGTTFESIWDLARKEQKSASQKRFDSRSTTNMNFITK